MPVMNPETTLIYQAQHDDNAYYACELLRDQLRRAYGVSAGFDITKQAPPPRQPYYSGRPYDARTEPCSLRLYPQDQGKRNPPVRTHL